MGRTSYLQGSQDGWFDEITDFTISLPFLYCFSAKTRSRNVCKLSVRRLSENYLLRQKFGITERAIRIAKTNFSWVRISIFP